MATVDAYVLLEHRVREGSREPELAMIDSASTQILGVFATAREAVQWIAKTFEETAGARRDFADAEKLALFNLLVSADSFIENAYSPVFIPLMPGKVMQVIAGPVLGSLSEALYTRSR